jgi:DNA-binding NarL/FixJ family response regulator
MKDSPEHILVVGSQIFGKSVASALKSKPEIVVRASVSLDLFMGQWQPDVVVVDCDEAEPGVATIADSLGRLRSKPPVVWVTRTHPPSYIVATSQNIVRRRELRKQLPSVLEAAWKRRALT